MLLRVACWALLIIQIAPAFAMSTAPCSLAVRDFYVSANQIAEKETREFPDGFPHYTIDGTVKHARSYQTNFLPLLAARPWGRARSFPDLLENRRSSGKSTHAADFFGSGLFLKEPSHYLDSVVGFRLLPIHPEMLPEAPWSTRREEIHGDLYSSKGWKRVDEYLKRKELDGFDLILAKPEGGTHDDDPETSALAHLLMLRKMYRRLAPGGEMFAQVRGEISSLAEYLAWLERVRSTGIPIHYHQSDAFLTRDAIWIGKPEGAPYRLPL